MYPAAGWLCALNEHVHYLKQVALPGQWARQTAGPQAVGPRGTELPVDPGQRACCHCITHRNAHDLAAHQSLAERLDPEGMVVLVDEVPQDLSRRSSCAGAKTALASFNISWARRSSSTSRSRYLTRSARSQPSCDGLDYRPQRRVLPAVLLRHPHRTLTDLGRELVWLLNGFIFSSVQSDSLRNKCHSTESCRAIRTECDSAQRSLPPRTSCKETS